MISPLANELSTCVPTSGYKSHYSRGQSKAKKSWSKYKFPKNKKISRMWQVEVEKVWVARTPIKTCLSLSAAYCFFQAFMDTRAHRHTSMWPSIVCVYVCLFLFLFVQVHFRVATFALSFLLVACVNAPLCRISLLLLLLLLLLITYSQRVNRGQGVLLAVCGACLPPPLKCGPTQLWVRRIQ